MTMKTYRSRQRDSLGIECGDQSHIPEPETEDEAMGALQFRRKKDWNCEEAIQHDSKRRKRAKAKSNWKREDDLLQYTSNRMKIMSG